MYDLLSSLHYLPVAQRISYKLCLLCYKCIHGLAPAYLNELIIPRQQSHYHNLRINNDEHLLHLPNRLRYAKMKSAFSYIAPFTWNSLPHTVRSIQNLKQFKSALKTYLYECAFPVTEF